MILRKLLHGRIFPVVESHPRAGDRLSVGIENATSDWYRAPQAQSVRCRDLLASVRVPLETCICEIIDSGRHCEFGRGLRWEGNNAGTIAPPHVVFGDHVGFAPG